MKKKGFWYHALYVSMSLITLVSIATVFMASFLYIYKGETPEELK